MTLLFVYLFIALSVSFLCSILEATLLSSTNSYIESLCKETQVRGVLLFKGLKSNIDRPISAILILNTFAHTMGAAGVGAEAQKLFGEEWQTLIAVGLTLLILYLTEILPKVIGATYWKSLIIPAAYIIHYMIKITYPLMLVSAHLSHLFSKGKPRHSYSREEILAVVELGEREGSLLTRESALIENLLKLKEYRAKNIMTPRSVVFAFKNNVTIAQAIEQNEMYVYSRIPVYQDSVDTITGLVFNQNILEQSVGEHEELTMEQISVPVFHVSENLPVLNLLDLFIKRKEHLFVVHDSYGQTAGIVTMEDAIETLLGVEIMDEMDQVSDMQLLAKERSRIFHHKVKRDFKEAQSAKDNEST